MVGNSGEEMTMMRGSFPASFPISPSTPLPESDNVLGKINCHFFEFFELFYTLKKTSSPAKVVSSVPDPEPDPDP